MKMLCVLAHLLVITLLTNAQTEISDSTCERGTARLVGGSSGNVGVLEVCNDGQWTTVCRDSVDSREANLICRHMGWLPIDSEREVSTLYDSPVPGSRTVRIECSSTHGKFGDCPIVALGSRSCSSTTALRCSPCLKLRNSNSKLFYCKEGSVTEKGVKCMYSDMQCNGVVDCGGGEDEHYCDVCSETEGEGKLRLVDGHSLREGRLEICMNGGWGTVCSSSFDNTDAGVVCRQLGFPTSRAKVRRFISGATAVPIWLDGVECTGTEKNLLECRRRENAQCTHSHDVGVMCLPECTTDGDVRVVNGSGPHEGRVEVCYDGHWGSVCDEGWDQNEAAVICRQLGYATRGSLAYRGAAFGVGDVILKEVVCSGAEEGLFDCMHNVLDVNCTQLGVAGVSCAACGDEQYTCSMVSLNGSRCINSSKLCDGVIDCVGGEDEEGVRLVDGVLPVQGRVEYCSNGLWQTVCDDRWDRNDARVVCRELGYESPDPRSECCATFGQGEPAQSIFLSDFQCNGRERNISQCLTTVRGRTCRHTEDAAVVCRCNFNTYPCRETSAENPVCITDIQFCDGIADCPEASDEPDNCALECSFNGELRLVGGDSSNEGRVEVCFRGRWGSVCDNSWDYHDAAVVCKQLGFGTLGAEAQVNSFFGQGEIPIHLDSLRCEGTEESLIQCNRNQFGHVSSNCRDHSDDASVICPTVCPDHLYQCEYGRVDGQTPPCITHQQRCDSVSDCNGGEDEMEHNCLCSPNGAVRLVGGIVPYRGRVEYCVSGRWLGTCSFAWDQREATVVCRQLGYPTEGATSLCCGHFETTPSRQPIFRDYFLCGGNERNLSLCSHSPGSQCQSSQHAGVVCRSSTQPFLCLDSGPEFESNVTELHFCDGNNDCSDGSDEPTSCAQECMEPGKIRLVLGEEVGGNKGRVEICFGGKWGTICDDSWDHRDAQVVCRQLGFGSTDAIAYGGSRYNPGAGPVHLDDVDCRGSEQNIKECTKRNYGSVSSNCRSHFEDASVICSTICSDDTYQCQHGRNGSLGSPCISHSQRCDGVTDCIGGEDELEYNCPCEPEGSVRLVDGIVPYRGRVEICRGNRWASVCRNGWGSDEASVICRQLGYTTSGARPDCCNKYIGAPEHQPIIHNRFNCRGNEMNISQCPIDSSSYTCNHNSDANVVCKADIDDYLCRQESLLRVSELEYCDGVENCVDGSDEPDYCPAECHEPGGIRLVNSNIMNATEGRVEICFGGEWGTICDTRWGYRQAQVVCRQLGFGTRGAIHLNGAEYGPGSGRVLIDSVTCSGLEQNITSCQLNTIGNVNSNCQSHNRDVSVVCSVCPDSMLECSSGRVDGQQPPCVSSEQRCDGNIDCIGGEDEEDYNCPCGPDGSVRLVGSPLPYPFQGRLEYCVNGRWSTMCHPSYYGTYISRFVSVVCHQLGYTGGNVAGYTRTIHGRGYELQPIFRDALDCRGSERNLSECRALPSRRGSCTHYDDLSLTCGNTNDQFLCSSPLPNTSSNVSLLQVCDGVMDCSNSSDETICSNSDCSTPGRLRLVENVQTGEEIGGVVEICIAGRWSTIGCASSWREFEAAVACRQLGYATIGAVGSSTSFYERPPLIARVDCRGSERGVLNCSMDTIGNFLEICGSTVATVTCASVCPEDTIECTDGRIDGQSPACVSFEERCNGIAECIGGEDELEHNCPCSPEGDVKLVGGVVPHSGRVEWCVNGHWLTPCRYWWDNTDAGVVCTQLGYSRQGAQGSTVYGSGHPFQPVYPYDIRCYGGENSLLECRTSDYQRCTNEPDPTVTCTCSSSQRECPNEFQLCDGHNDTTDGSDEGSICYNECRRPGEVRLVDGDRTDGSRGSVEICFQGRWGRVCDIWWDDLDAQVICRQLGYNSIGAIGIGGSYYGQGSGPIFLDRIRCSGEEANLTQCSWNLVEHVSLTCSHASVQCQIDECILMGSGSGQMIDGDENDDEEYDDVHCPGSCIIEGAVRLVGGRTPHEGRVELCRGGQWARMCDRRTTSNNARVICRQLGYPTQNVNSWCCSSRYGPYNDAQPTVMSRYDCTGSEPNITECGSTPIDIFCGPSTDTIVTCNCPDVNDVPCQYQNSNGSTTCVSELQLCDGIADCPQGTDEENCGNECTTPGAVHLVDSHGTTGGNEGRVEVCFNGEWGTICDDNWDHLDAQVVCRQLGFSSLGASGSSGPYYGTRRKHVLLDDVQCAGSEETLIDCSRRPFLHNIGSNCFTERTSAVVDCKKVCPFGTFECQLNNTHKTCISHNKRCDGITDCLGGVDELDQNCPCTPEGSVRLVDGIVPYRGRVEICVDGTWSTICSSYSWGSNEVSVVCRQLGYDSGDDYPCCSRRFPISQQDEQPLVYDSFLCDGTETNITECRRSRGLVCNHYSDVSVICSSDTQQFLCQEQNATQQDVSELQYCDGNKDCFDGSDEADSCSSECSMPGKVRLVDYYGRTAGLRGRVEICFGGRWGIVCGNNWGYREAEVVCRQLGFASRGATGSISYLNFPTGSRVHLDQVVCEGTEKSLSECNSRPFGVTDNNCITRSIEVICQGCPDNTTECENGRIDGIAPSCISNDKLCDGVVDCIGGDDELDYNCPCTPEGAVRLVDGNAPHQGRLEFCNGGLWSTICDFYSWGISEASVVCRQLGYHTTGEVTPYALFGTRPHQQHQELDEFRCRGNEANVTNCQRVRQRSCNRDVEIICSCPDVRMSPCWLPNQTDSYCVSLFQLCDGNEDCPSGSDETHDCGSECTNPGELRLVKDENVGGNEGRVEICMKGKWGTICDELWTVKDAAVACRHLGFGSSRAVSYTGAYFGPGKGPVHLTQFRCIGFERNLTECEGYIIARSFSSSCTHFHDASVSCPTICPDDQFMCSYGRQDGRQPACISTDKLCDGVSDCSAGEDELDYNCPCSPDGSVRLVDGILPHQGRVELCWSKRWTTTCTRFSYYQFAVTVCRQLGLPSDSAELLSCCSFPPGPQQQLVVQDRFSCSSTAQNITDCIISEDTYYNCGHERDIGVTCECPEENQFPCNTTDGAITCISDLQYCDGTLDCADGSDEPSDCLNECSVPGQLQLVNGADTSGHEGRLEICYKGQWGSVCQDSWNYFDTKVACRQLGLGTIEAVSYTGSRYGRGLGPVFLNNLQCAGMENTLAGCDRSPFGRNVHTCSDHSRDISIKCGRCPDASMFECKSGRRDGQNPPCISIEQRCNNVTECLEGEDELPHNCPCSPEGAVQLVGGSGSHEGRVEFCRKTVWVTVCHRYGWWSSTNTGVVCHQLGYARQGAQTQTCCNVFGSGPTTQPIYPTRISCSGSEEELSECNEWPYTRCTSHNYDVGVICQV